MSERQSLFACFFYRAFKLYWLLFFAGQAGASVVRHTLLPNDSVFTVQTQHACMTYLLQPSPHWCNPALFPFANESPIKSDVALNADQDAYDTTAQFINEEVDQAFVEKLFREKDFQSFSGLIRLEAMSSYLSFVYIPAYVVGAYKLSNPNLPELAAAGSRESQFRLTSGTKLAEGREWSLYGGGSVNLFDRKLYYIHTNALELVVRNMDTLLEEEHSLGINADAGLYVHSISGLFPSFSWTTDNVFAPQPEGLGDERPLALVPNYSRRMRLGSGYTFSHMTGSYHIGIQLPFWNALERFDRLGASTALIYGIGRLRTFAAYGPLMGSFGFLFMGTHYHVGIQYTSDKQDNSLELRRRKNVYLFTSFNF